MTGKLVMGHSAGVAIAEALGLVPQQISAIHLHFEVGEIVGADVRMFVFDGQVEQIASVLKRYELREADLEEGAA